MANVIFSLRIPEELKESLEQAAKVQGMTVSDLIREQMMVRPELEAPVRKMVEGFCEGLGVTTQEFVEAVLIRRMAERAAHNEVWGSSPEKLPEFTRLDGRLMKGEQLYQFLLTYFRQDEERERERILLADEQWGLSPEDSEWLKARHVGRAWYESEEYAALRSEADAQRARVDLAKAQGLIPADCKNIARICNLLDMLERNEITEAGLSEILGKTGFDWVGEEGKS